MQRARPRRCAGVRQLPVQYADYTLWQRERLGEEDDPESLLARQLAFWKTALAGAPEELGLPRRPPTPAGGQLSRGARTGLHSRRPAPRACRPGPRVRGQPVHGAAGRACSAVVPAGGGQDIPIGTPIAGRGETPLEELVGFFVNTLVLRTDVSGDPTFRELVGRVRAFALEAYDHQDVPFERVVEALRPARSLARAIRCSR